MAGLESLGLGSLGAVITAETLMTFVTYGGVMLALAALMWWGWQTIQYKYKVIIIEKRGEKDQVIAEDTGKKWKTKEGIEKIWLKKTKQAVELPNYRYMHNLKGNFFQKQVLVYYRYGDKSITPVNVQNVLDTKGVSLTPIEADVSQMVSIIDEIEKKYDTENFWEKYGQIIITGFMFAILLLMLLFVSRTLEAVSGNLGHALEQIAHAAEQLAECQVPEAAPGFGG